MQGALGDSSDVFAQSRFSGSLQDSKDSGVDTVTQESDDLQINLSGTNDEHDEGFGKRVEQRIREMYPVLYITMKKSVAKTNTEGLGVAMDYVRRVSTVQA